MTWVDAIWYERTEASNERIDKIFTLALAATERREVREKKHSDAPLVFQRKPPARLIRKFAYFQMLGVSIGVLSNSFEGENGGKRRKLYENTLLLFSSRKLPSIEPAYAKHFRWGIISFYRPFYESQRRERERERERERMGEKKIEIDNKKVRQWWWSQYGKIAYCCG